MRLYWEPDWQMKRYEPGEIVTSYALPLPIGLGRLTLAEPWLWPQEAMRPIREAFYVWELTPAAGKLLPLRQRIALDYRNGYVTALTA